MAEFSLYVKIIILRLKIYLYFKSNHFHFSDVMFTVIIVSTFIYLSVDRKAFINLFTVMTLNYLTTL